MLALLAILFAPAYLLVIVGAWRAPVGHEDAAGFHYGAGPEKADAPGDRAATPALAGESLALPPVVIPLSARL